MSDEMKDFRYYADKAEEYLDEAERWTHTAPRFDVYRSIAAVYAELAKAAPKADSEPKSKSNFFYFVNGNRVEGERCFGQRFTNPLVDPAKSQCMRRAGHGGLHETADGARFETADD